MCNLIYRLAIGFTCCALGVLGLLVLGIAMYPNFIWLVKNIFLPGMFNGFAGLISTFVAIYASQDGVSYGPTTIAALVTTGTCSLICSVPVLIYAIKNREIISEHTVRMLKGMKLMREGGGEI